MFEEKSISLADLAFESPDLQEVAEALQLEIRLAEAFTRSGGAGIAAYPEVVEAAFSASVLLDGYNSDVLEIEDGRQLVVRLVEHQPSELRALAEVADEARQQLVRDRARVLALEKRDLALEALETGSISAYVADQAGSEWEVIAGATRFRQGVDKAVLDAAFQLPKPEEGGKSLGSLVLDNDDAVLIVVTRVSDPSTSSYQDLVDLGIDRDLAARRGSSAYFGYMQRLVDLADISDR